MSDLNKIIELIKTNDEFLKGSYEEIFHYLITKGNFTEGIGCLIAKSLVIIKQDIFDLISWIRNQ